MRIALATHLGGLSVARACDMALAEALAARGAEPEFLLCDGALPACSMTATRISPQTLLSVGQDDLCSRCFGAGVSEIAARKRPVRMMSDAISADIAAAAARLAAETPVEKIRGLEWAGIKVGEYAYGEAARFLGGPEQSREAEPVLRRFLVSAARAAAAMQAAIRERGYEVVVVFEGTGTPQGAAAAAATALGARVVVWRPASRRSCFIFDHGPAPQPDEGDAADWRALVMTDRMREDLARYVRDAAGASAAGEPFEHDLLLKRRYHMLFRRMIPLPFIIAASEAARVDWTAAGDLRPGAWPGLDVICDGVIDGAPFVYPAERMSAPFGHEARFAA